MRVEVYLKSTIDVKNCHRNSDMIKYLIYSTNGMYTVQNKRKIKWLTLDKMITIAVDIN